VWLHKLKNTNLRHQTQTRFCHFFAVSVSRWGRVLRLPVGKVAFACCSILSRSSLICWAWEQYKLPQVLNSNLISEWLTEENSNRTQSHLKIPLDFRHSNVSSLPSLFNEVDGELPSCFLNLLFKSFFVCISESQDVSCWGCNANSTFLPTLLNWRYGVSLKKSYERTHGGSWRRSSYSFYVSWNCRSLHKEHCWRRRAYVIIFRMCRELDSTFRGCFPCIVCTVHPTLVSSTIFC